MEVQNLASLLLWEREKNIYSSSLSEKFIHTGPLGSGQRPWDLIMTLLLITSVSLVLFLCSSTTLFKGR